MSNLPMPEGSARAKTYNPVLDKLEVLNEKGKINYHTFKPVLFEFPTYEYFVTGEKVGSCGKMN